MAIRTARDLKRYLETKSFSPESFARETKISNMTIRRMLRHSSTWRIPEKYHLQLDFHEKSKGTNGVEKDLPTFALPTDFKVLMKDLQKSGSKKNVDIDDLKEDVQAKLTKAKMGSNFATHVRYLVSSLTQKLDTKSKALSVGALLYFVNPFDFIPDALPAVGYLDDFAVLALVCAYLKDSGKMGMLRKSRI